MSKLRKKLQRARHEYQHLRYEGDLASDVLDRLAPPVRKGSHWMRHLAIAASLALAATAAIVVLSRGKSTREDVAIVTPPADSIGVVTTPDQLGPTDGTDAVDATPDGGDPADQVAANGAAEVEEELWSLVPTQVAAASESSFSLVPSMQSVSFGVPSLDELQETENQ